MSSLAPARESDGLPPDLTAAAPRRLTLAWLWATRWRAVLALGVIAALVYIGSLWNGFAYDDASIVGLDPRISGFQFGKIWSLPYWQKAPELAIYRPLTTLSFAVDWAISRGYPWFFHLMNVLEHGIASALVFLVLGEVFAPVAAFAAALLFAVHPVHVEAVANVVGRAEVMSAVFYLGATLIWIRGGSRSSPGRVLLVALCYAIALLHKESSATLPATLILVDAALGRFSLRLSGLREYLRRALPLFLAMALVLAGFLVLRWQVLGRMAPSVLDSTFDLPMSAADRVVTALQLWPTFARLLFFPLTLLADYGPRINMPLFQWTPLAIAGLLMLLVLVVGGLNALWSGQGRTALGMLWFPVTILPVSNLLFPIGIIVAERTLYLPLFALCVGLAAAVEWGALQRPRLRSGLAAALVVVLAAFAVRTAVRVPEWDSTDSIFYALRRDRPDSFRAWWHLARIARRDKKVDLEIKRYAEAYALWPYRRSMAEEIATQAAANNRVQFAHTVAEFGARRWPGVITFQRVLAGSALDLGDTASARRAMAAGLKLAPADTFLLRMSRALQPAAPAPRNAGSR